MANRIVTLEVDSTVIRLMETRGEEIIRWASLSLEPNMSEDGVIADPQALGAAVRQLVDSSGIKAKNVITSVSGLYSVSRIVAVPSLPGTGVTAREAILEATRNVMPISTDELYLAWQSIAASGESQQVLVVGVPRDVIDSELQALKAAGISPRTVDLKAIALTRAVNKEQALILNIEPTSFDIVIVAHGLPEVMRTTAWQREGLTAEDRVEQLTLGLELTVGFYNSHHSNTPLDPTTPLTVTGQMSGDPDLVGKLQARMGYPVEPLAPPMEYPKHLPIAQYAVNIGLALREMMPAKSPEADSRSLPNINLLPDTYKPWRPSHKQIYFACCIMAAIILLFPLYQMAAGAMDDTAELQSRYDIFNAELQRKKLEIANREPLQQAINDYNTIVDMGGGFTEALVVINNEAQRLGVRVETITHEGNKIKLTCQAGDYTVFREYVTALRESGQFTKVTPPPEQFTYIEGGSIELEPK